MAQTTQNIDELSLEVTLGNQNSPYNLLTRLNISEKLKRAFKEEIELRQGLKIALNEYKLKKKVKINFSIDIAPLEFAFCISGKAKSQILINGKLKEIELKKGMFAIFYFPDSNGSIEIGGLENVKILSLHISPDYLRNFVADDIHNLPDSIQNLLSEESNDSFIITSEMTPTMIMDTQQIFDTKMKGAARRMYYESKALELMTLTISEISDNFETNNIILSEFETSMINLVKDKLNQNLINPPSLLDLTTLSGMSHNKLNKVFKKLYNTTVFGYLRNLRLEYSKMLLSDSKYSITQITYEAGWSNPSHFSKEFAKAYSITPKQFRNEHLKLNEQTLSK